MATINTHLTDSIIANEIMMHLENNLVFGNNVHRDYKKEFKKKGDTINIKKPVYLLSHDGADITDHINTITEESVELTLNHQFVVPFSIKSKDMTLSVKSTEEELKSAGITLANDIDTACAQTYKQVYNAVGTPGSTPDSYLDFGLVNVRMDQLAMPRQERKAVIDSLAAWTMKDALKGISHEGMAKDIVANGFLDRVAQMDLYSDQNIQYHTKGADTAVGVTNGANQTGSSLVTDGWTASTGVVTEGDNFTIAGVYAVNPISKQIVRNAGVAQLRQFVATSAVTSDSSGNATISISPSIVVTGPNQNCYYDGVNGAPDGAAITILASHTANLAFNKKAIALVTADLELPDGAPKKSRIVSNGISLRVIQWYDGMKDINFFRVDVLCGVKCINPDLAVRFVG